MPCSTWPPGICTFWVCRARTTSATVRPTPESLVESVMTLIWRGRPPTSLAWPTPLIDSIWRFRLLSANSVMSRMGAGPESAIRRIGWASGSIFSMIGGSASLGSWARTELIRSRTSWEAMSPFFSRSKEATTTEVPSDEVEISWSMPETVLTASSILSVISVSISSGEAPTRRVVMVIVGRSTLGKRSTPSLT